MKSIRLLSRSVLVSAILGFLGAAQASGIDVGVPAYVWPGNPYLEALKNPQSIPVPPAIVVVNINNGYGEITCDNEQSTPSLECMDPEADTLRARTAADGKPVRVIGYVHSMVLGGTGRRPLNDVKADIDRWLVRDDSQLHYDGIFVDEATRDCGTTTGDTSLRDYYRAIREHVWLRMGPDAEDLVVNNVGTAVDACYLEAGHATADIFITYEGDAATYAQVASAETNWVGWTGGNVIVDGQYDIGAAYPSWRFWHLVYATGPVDTNAIDLAYVRHAGTVTSTDDTLPNPWDGLPGGLDLLVDYAHLLGD